MTALNILTNAFRAVGLEVAAPSVTNTSFQTRQMVQFINEAGLDVARRTHWQAMMTTDTITGPTSSHPLPSDFFALDAVSLSESTWQPVRIIIDAKQWAFLQRRATAQPYCHIEGDNLLFSPAVGANGARMRYVSDQWLTGKTAVTSDSDVPQVPERLVEKGAIWRWKRQHGMPYDDILAEFEADLVAELPANRGAA